MAENLYRALWSWIICVLVTVGVSLVTEPKSAESLHNLTLAYTEFESDGDLPLYERPVILGAGVLVLFAVIQVIFW